MDSDLILITGAASEVGKALIRALLAKSTCRILAYGFSAADDVMQLAQEFGERVIPLRADLSDPHSGAHITAELDAQEVPSAIIHLPAIEMRHELFTKLRLNSFEAGMAVQVYSAMVLMQQLLPNMAKLPRGRVVFVLSSIIHGVPPKFLAQSTVVAYAQLGLMRALAAEYAASSIRINAVSFGVAETQLGKELDAVSLQEDAAVNPLGATTPADVVDAILFLLSPAADYVSGITIPIAAG